MRPSMSGQVKAAAAPGPRAPAGPVPRFMLRSFFWEPLPDGHIPRTFWERHPPALQPLQRNQALVENMFQVGAHHGSCKAIHCSTHAN